MTKINRLKLLATAMKRNNTLDALEGAQIIEGVISMMAHGYDYDTAVLWATTENNGRYTTCGGADRIFQFVKRYKNLHETVCDVFTNEYIVEAERFYKAPECNVAW